MSAGELKELLTSRKIDQVQFKIYALFELQDQGREMLNLMLDSIILEEPVDMAEPCFAWHDGRRSVWRHIKVTINMINSMIEEMRNA